MIEIYVESKNKTKGKETTNEVDFVETIVKHWFPDFEYDKDFKVIGADGKDNLPNLTPSFELNNVNGDQTIVIFDADSADNHGGFSVRKAWMEDTRKEMGVDFEFFLWPNNKDDGDFESVLLNIVADKYKGILDCYNGFEMCLRGKDPDGKMFDLPGRKAVVRRIIERLPLPFMSAWRGGQGVTIQIYLKNQ